MNDDQAPTAFAFTRRTALAGLGIGIAAAALTTRHASAQDATPSPVAAVGVTGQLMGAGQPAVAEGMELTLRRTTIAVGGSIPAHSHPGALVIFVEAGAFGYTTLGGKVELTRAAVAGTPSPVEAMPIGTEVILNPGDWLFAEDPQDDVRNAGEDDVVLLISGLTRVGEPFSTFMGG